MRKTEALMTFFQYSPHPSNDNDFNLLDYQ